MPKEVIIIKTETDKKGETVEAWGSLTAICKNHKTFQYHTIKKIAFPFIHKGYEFIKVKYNTKLKLKK
jgi:hypothetical protein